MNLLDRKAEPVSEEVVANKLGISVEELKNKLNKFGFQPESIVQIGNV